MALGGLNTVAQFVTILFLTLYVAINLSAAAERWAGDPSYRPTIDVPWLVSLLGALAAGGVMFLISPLACFVAIGLELLLYVYVRRRSLQRHWGDARAGVWMALARFALLRLREHRDDPRNWRPNILVFVGDPEKRLGLVRLASWFNQDRGIVTACQLIEGDLTQDEIDIERLRGEMDRALDEDGLLAFGEVDVVREFESGVLGVAQANGIAGLESNTVIVGWPSKPGRLESWLRIMRALSRIGKITLITRLNWAHEPGQEQRIDIWWGGLESNGDMMLLLAHLLRLNPEWSGARLTIRSIARSEEGAGVPVAGSRDPAARGAHPGRDRDHHQARKARPSPRSSSVTAPERTSSSSGCRTRRRAARPSTRSGCRSWPRASGPPSSSATPASSPAS